MRSEAEADEFLALRARRDVVSSVEQLNDAVVAYPVSVATQATRRTPAVARQIQRSRVAVVSLVGHPIRLLEV